MNIYGCSSNFLQNFVTQLYVGNILKHDLGVFGLANIEIFVPTRRAARALRDELIAQQQGSILLPNIIAFSDIESIESLQASIGQVDRMLILSQLIHNWQKQIESQNLDLANAIWLAQDLANLLDEAALAGIDWQNLAKIEAELGSELSQWWNISSDFLKIATTEFPKILAQYNLIDIGQHRALQVAGKIKEIKANSAKARIVLGATGAVPCVAEFLKIIAGLENGAVVLPALDPYVSQDVWETISNTPNASLYSYAQYNYHKLLKKLGVSEKDIIFLDTRPAHLEWRQKYISYALMPAEATDCWYELEKNYVAEAFADVALIEAEEEGEEALAIACALCVATRQDSAKKVALVTSNRNLARRVSAHLKRFGIIANDSAQQPFFSVDFGRWLRLILLNFSSSDINIYLSLLRHPLTNFGYNKEEFDELLDRYEKYYLRGAILRFSVHKLEKLHRQMHEQWLDREGEAQLIGEVEALSHVFSKNFKIISELFGKNSVSLKNALQVLQAFIKALAPDLKEEKGYEEFQEFCENIAVAMCDVGFAPTSFYKVFEALFSTINLEAERSYSNVHIWGVIEARLQNADLVVLAGLNENQFPLAAESSIFISRPTMMKLGLAPPEERIGAEALEFQYLMNMNEVILSRSKRVDGVVQIPSRWLQRLQSLIGPEQAAKLGQRGQKYLSYAAMIDRTSASLPKAEPPICCPPIEQRAKNFSITDIEILQTSPYAIYAKKILRLIALEPLAKIPNAAEKGSLYHSIVADFLQQNRGQAQYEDIFAKIIELNFAQQDFPEDIAYLWRAELAKIAPKFLTYEKNELSRKTYVELPSRAIPIGFCGASIAGRADRIDIIGDSATISDFKTGAKITQKSVRNFQKPQLLLEANLLLKGAFNIEEKVKYIENLLYIYLKDDGKDALEVCPALGSKVNLPEIIEESWEYTQSLIDSYFQPNKAYIAYEAHADRLDMARNPYHHLTRYEEWSR